MRISYGKIAAQIILGEQHVKDAHTLRNKYEIVYGVFCRSFTDFVS